VVKRISLVFVFILIVHVSTFFTRLARHTSSSADQSVSLSAFGYLYSEMVQYHQNRVDSISELERRLEATGYGVGLRVLELLAYRAKEYKRETRLMNLLQFVSTVAWKSLFGKAADSLERSIDHADEFMIVDYAPITR
jgi:trafficking protein particle complex subunit 5